MRDQVEAVVKVIGQMKGQIERMRIRGKWVTLLARKGEKLR